MKKIGMRRVRAPKKPIPRFRSLQEEATFWETHDSTDYFSDDDLVPLLSWTRGRKVRHIFVAPDGSRYRLIPLTKKKRGRVSA